MTIITDMNSSLKYTIYNKGDFMLYGPGVRDGRIMDDDPPSHEDNRREMRRIAAQEARRVYEKERLKQLFSGSLEDLWKKE